MLINTEYARLLPREKKELLKILEISERAMFYWLEEPAKMKMVNKEAIRNFLNKKLEKKYSLRDLFQNKSKQPA